MYSNRTKIDHEGRLYRNYGVILMIFFVVYTYYRRSIRSQKCVLWLLVTECEIYIGNMLEVIAVIVWV